MLYFFRLCGKFWWIILIIAAITTSSAAYLSYYYFPSVYSTSTTLFILNTSDNTGANKDSEYQNLLASEMLVKDYTEMVKSSMVIQKVKEDLRNDLPELKTATIQEISDKITVSAKPGTRLIEITVEQHDPIAAAAIANKTAEIFKEKSFELIKTENVTIINQASIPDQAKSPKPVQNILMGLLSGLVGSIVIILFIDYIRRQIAVEKSKLNNGPLTV